MYRFCAYGLIIDSEVNIPGASLVAGGDMASPDANIRLGKVNLPHFEQSDGPYARHGDQLLFAAPNVARYLCTSGSEILIEPSGGADHEEVMALLIATALPMLVWMRSGFVLHAGAVILPNQERAIAIAGPSGAGKSTIIDALVNRGAALVGDDTLSIRIDGETARTSGLPSAYFVRQGEGDDRILRTVSESRQRHDVILGAIVVIDSIDLFGAKPTTRLSGVSALEALLRGRHRPRIPAILGREKAVFEFCALLCERVPIYSYARKDGDIRSALDAFTDMSNSIKI